MLQKKIIQNGYKIITMKEGLETTHNDHTFVSYCEFQHNLHSSSWEHIQILYICFLKWPPQHRNGNRFVMNTTTRISKLFLTAQTVNPPRFPLHVPNESIADKHPINIQIFCRKLRFRCQRILCIILGVQDQVRYTVSWLHWPVYAL